MFIGIPGSQRKEFAQKLALENGFAYFLSDDVRKEMEEEQGEVSHTLLFEEMHRRLRKLLDKGEDVVFDATNLYSKHRKHLKQLLKNHEIIAHYVATTLEECISNDRKDEIPLGEDFIIQKFMTAEIPMLEEGFKTVYYYIEPVSVDAVNDFLTQKNQLVEEDEVIAWAKVFMETGKPILESRPENQYKKIGYNNMSAQIAFQVLYTMSYHIDFIREVVQLILFKNRFAKANEPIP